MRNITMLFTCMLLALLASKSQADTTAIYVNHYGQVVLADLKKGTNPEWEVQRTYFRMGYFHEIASWKWKPIVTQQFDRKFWPTKKPLGQMNDEKYVYNGRISTCPYQIQMSRPAPGQVKIKYTVDSRLKDNPSVQDREFRDFSRRGLLFITNNQDPMNGLKFNKHDGQQLLAYQSDKFNCRFTLTDKTIRKYTERKGQDAERDRMHLYDLNGIDSDQIEFELVIDVPEDFPVIFDNRKLGVHSDQSGWNTVDMQYDSYPMDLSDTLLDAPAGKHGFLTVQDGKFRFQKLPGVNQYFSGTTLVHSSKFPYKKEAERIADRVAAMGCNLLRLHHLDYFIPGFGIFDREDMKNGKTGAFDAELLDRMDYLMYCLKERGVYIHLDGITARKFLKNDTLKEGQKLSYGLKGSAYLSDDPDLLQVQQDYFSKLWNHVNPYTQLAYKDDPAIVTAAVLNESDLYLHRSLDHHFPPHYRKLFENLFEQWKVKMKQLGGNLDQRTRRVEDVFRASLMRQYFQRMNQFMKDMNPYRPVLGTNWIKPERLQLLASYDHVDFTADHPYRNGLIHRDELNLFHPDKRHFKYLSLAKLHDKPVMHEEWNSLGSDRAGTLALAMAVMASCDHDVSTIFSLFHHFDLTKKQNDILSLNIARDPARAFILSAMNPAFIRRDFKPNPDEYIYMLTDHVLWGRGKGTLDQDSIYEIYPSYAVASFFGRCAFAFTEQDTQEILKRNPQAQIIYPGQAPDNLPGPQQYPIRNGTGEIELYWKESYMLGKTKATKMALGAWPSQGEVDLGDGLRLTVTGVKNVDAVLTSLTDEPLSSTSKMMVVLAGRVELKDMYFDAAGENPVAPSSEIVAEPIHAQLKLPLTIKNPKVWGRNPDNSRATEYKAVREDDCWVIKLSGESLVYEIVSE